MLKTNFLYCVAKGKQKISVGKADVDTLVTGLLG
jgi:hypothetical protein